MKKFWDEYGPIVVIGCIVIAMTAFFVAIDDGSSHGSYYDDGCDPSWRGC
ncbi:hypothetical protein [Cereibacter johrii]|nr:hypothetical protein [Cereibacter johrii]